MNVEYSLGPFCNWFLPSCLDIWSSSDGQRVLCSYGARSNLCLLNVTQRESFKAHDCLNVFPNKSIVSVNRFNKTTAKSFKTPILFVGSNEGEAALIDCFTNNILRQKNKLEDLKDLPSRKILSADWVDERDSPVVYYSMHSVVIRWNTKTNTTDVLKIGDNYRNKIAISCITSSSCGRKKLAVGSVIIYLIRLLLMN